MPLTHVCVWDSKTGYRRVTVEEACEMYPYGASARSGHFVCELCAQNVLLTAPGMNVQHFRHDPASPNKECDERQASFDPNYGRSLRALNSHIMPLRLVVTGSIFSLQLGFFYSLLIFLFFCLSQMQPCRMGIPLPHGNTAVPVANILMRILNSQKAGAMNMMQSIRICHVRWALNQTSAQCSLLFCMQPISTMCQL